MNEFGKEDETKAQAEEIAALEIIGVFLAVLGGTMVVAAFWPPTWTGRVTNLVVAVLLLGIGLAMFLRGRAVRKAGTRHAKPGPGDPNAVHNRPNDI